MRTGSRSERELRIVGIAGSLRRGSYNRALLEAARELAPEGVSVEVAEIRDLPLFDADIDTDDLRPPAVERLKRSVAEADAVLFATPEYNYGVSGVLKNAIDWISRPSMKSPLAGKPVAGMGASAGSVGTARAQEELKLVLLSTQSYVMPHRGILVGRARERFDESLRLADEPTRELLAAFLRDLAAWARRFEAPARGSRAAA